MSDWFKESSYEGAVDIDLTRQREGSNCLRSEPWTEGADTCPQAEYYKADEK